jgi:branched-chain amino acid transport system substrate-binding protein
LLTAIAATFTATALIAGCGGSDVTEAASGLAQTTADTAASTGTATTTADTAVPGAVGTDIAKAGTTAAPGKAVDVPAGTQSGAAVDKAGKPVKNAGTAAVATGSALEKLVASAPIFGGSGPCKPATLSEVNIGNVSTISGVLGELFSPAVSAMQVFVAAQNACGGLNGHKIKFFVDDDQGDPSTAISKILNMIQNNKVLAFSGNVQVLTIDAIIPTIKKYGVPIIGNDITNNTWFTNPMLFPQGAPAQAISYAYLNATKTHFKKQNFGHVWCLEVPRACEQINRAVKEMAPQLGVSLKKDIQVSITSPSYVQQCLDLKNSGAEALALTFDAASMNRLARSCTQVGYAPDIMAYPLGVGNEKQFLGNSWLGDAYIPMNSFPWMGNSTGPEKFWQASLAKYNPNMVSGGAASLGWSAGALLVAASAGLSAQNPTTQQFLDTLYQFKGQKFTSLNGLLTSPLTFREGNTPKVPYCYFAAISNSANTGWATPVSKPICTDVIAPSDPQKNS